MGFLLFRRVARPEPEASATHVQFERRERDQPEGGVIGVEPQAGSTPQDDEHRQSAVEQDRDANEGRTRPCDPTAEDGPRPPAV